MTRLRSLPLLLPLGLLLGALLAPRAAHAQSEPTAKCNLVEVLVTVEPKDGVDTKIPPAVRGRLPKDQGNTFTFVAQRALVAPRGKPVAAKVANGDTFEIHFKELIASAGKGRLRIGVRLDDAGGKRVVDSTVAMDAGDVVIFGGSPYKNGKLVLALGCTH